MVRTLALPFVAAPVCVAALLAAGCFGDAELAACGISMTYCDGEDASAGPTGSADSSSSSTGAGIMTSDSLSGGSGGEGTYATGSASEGPTNTGGTGEASDLPPWIDELACDPPEAFEVGPTVVTYKASADAVEADLLDDGVVIATGPAGAPFVFPVTSGPANNPGSNLTVIVRDEAGQTAEASIFQPSVIKEPGSTVWVALEPHDGMFSSGGAVALDGNNAIGAGVHWENGQVLAILRRYDKSGTWIATSDGWTQKHTDWTERTELKTGNLGLGGLAVDDEGNIVAVGTAQIAGEPRMYVARFGSGGGLIWEVLGPIGTEARGVGVTADKSIYVAGSVRVKKGPDVWDMATWVYSPDKQAYGPDVFNDPTDTWTLRSERGYAVAVLESGRVAVAGTREVEDPITKDTYHRGVVLTYEGKGKRIGEWTSSGDKSKIDVIFAAAPTKTGLAVCGYAQNELNNPADKPQILIRWLGEDLAEVKAPRLEGTPGAATCHGLGTNKEGTTIVGATVHEPNKGGDNAWIFAVEDAASLRVDYMKRNGASNGQDRVLALACEYMCAWTGSEEVEGAAQWIAGMIRG